MIEAAPTVRRRTVKSLTNARPAFVSMVKAGSNMTPITVIKADVVQPVANQEAQDMSTTPTTTKTKTKGYDIARIEFDKSVFKDDSAVSKWLATGGYQDFAIKDDGTRFTVVGSGDIDKVIDTDTKLAIADGVTVHAVKKDVAPVVTQIELADVARETLVLDPQVPAAKSAKSALAVKFDSYFARYSDSQTLADAIVAGTYDGLPPGSDDVMGACRSVIANCAQNANADGIRQACTDLGDFLVQLITLFGVQADGTTNVVKSDESKAAVGKLVEDVLSSPAPAVEPAPAPAAPAAAPVAPVVTPAVVPAVSSDVGSVVPAVAPEAAPVVPAPAAEVVPAAGVEPAVTEPVVAPVAVDPLEKLTALITSLSENVAALTTHQQKQVETTQAAIDKAIGQSTAKSDEQITALTQRVEAVAAPRERQSLKGADVTEISAQQSAPGTPKPAVKQDRLVRDALGFR